MSVHYLHQPRGHRYVNVAGRQCLDTGKLVIGECHIPSPPRVISRDAETVQAALLEPRTAHERPLSLRLLGAFWSWA